MSSNLLTIVGVAAAGAVGAVARYLLGGLIAGRTGGAFPWDTFVINISAALVLGFVFAIFGDRFLIPPWIRTTIQVGFLGAYSTFSTWTLETLNLLQAGSWLLAGANVFGSILLGMLAVYGGTALGRLI
ncbi:MAG: CrcB family protein [Candidatus Dormiibacterota bacterium]